MSDPIQTIGSILTGGEKRDAIHIAVLPVIAGEDVRAGEPVVFVHGTSDQVVRCREEYGLRPRVGIIDPFITVNWGYVKKGERCWLFLQPNTVTGMRHEWTHPLVDNPPKVQNDAEKWLRDFADRWGFDWDTLIKVGLDPESDYIVANGSDLHSVSELGSDHDLFWKHLSIFTGKTFSEDHRAKVVWSCSC